MAKKLDLAGQTFGRWTALTPSTKTNRVGWHVYWWCECACGTKKEIHTGSLLSGHSKGCIKCFGLSHRGKNSVSWKGGRWTESVGYVKIWNSGKPRREHTLIAEKAMGRQLRSGEQVHHVNGIKTDNRPSNLLVCTASYHRWLENRMADLYKKEHFCHGD